MAKFVVSNTELIKKDYVVDAYTKEAAQEKAHLQPPRTKISLGEITHSITPINEFEYKTQWKDKWEEYKEQWKAQPDYNEGHDLNLDWIDQASGRNKRHKDDDSYDLYRDD